MVANLLIPPQLVFTDADGRPLAGGQLFTYIPGTLVQAPTWQDANQTILNTDPIILDARGACVAYGDGDYRLILLDSTGNQVFDLLSSEPLPASAISAAMLPVVGALTLQQARDLMGVTAAINAAISTINLMPGPIGPTGPQGPQGIQGPQGPSGASAGFQFQMTNPGYILFGTYGSSPILQFGSTVSDGSGNGFVSFPLAYTGGVLSVVCTAVSNFGQWWANPGSVNNGGFQFATSSPLSGTGNWQTGPQGMFWMAIGI